MGTAIYTRNRVRLEERVASQGRVDRTAGVIRGVKILGRVSKNGRVYSESAMQQAVVKYEGVSVYIDHDRDGGERRVADTFGYLQSVRFENGGVYGDLVFNREHSLANQICYAAENMPHTLGLSHAAEGSTARRNGETVVETVDRVFSVDLVYKAATNAGLFESHEGGHEMSYPSTAEAFAEGLKSERTYRGPKTLTMMGHRRNSRRRLDEQATDAVDPETGNRAMTDLDAKLLDIWNSNAERDEMLDLIGKLYDLRQEQQQLRPIDLPDEGDDAGELAESYRRRRREYEQPLERYPSTPEEFVRGLK